MRLYTHYDQAVLMVFSQTESRPHPALGLGATVLLSEGGSATAPRDLSREGSFVFWEASSVYKTKLGPPDNVYIYRVE